MFQRCLICTDFSDGLHRLVSFVPGLATSGLKQIVFLHSVPLWEEGSISRIDEEKVEQARIRLSAALENVPEGVEVNIELPSGRPLDTIPRILDKYQFDVIITGTPIRSLLQEKLFGSTSVALGKITTTPLLIFRPQLISTYTSEELNLRCQHIGRYLLIPYNDGKAARYLIEQIKHHIQDKPENSLEQCLLISVVDDSVRRGMPVEHRVQEATEKLKPVKSELEQLGLQVNTEVRQGNPVLAILEAAMEFDISAIAIASDYRSSLLEWTAPSFANDILRKSWFPMLFFSPKK